jgi:hypothetical protein
VQQIKNDEALKQLHEGGKELKLEKEVKRKPPAKV